MPKCAFLTIANTKGWFIDDDLVHPPLKQLGWEVENIPWDKPTDWNMFDLVIIRSTWDYQDHLEHFFEVLNNIENSKATLLNKLEIVKWNLDKNYLFELERKGVELIPTVKTLGLEKSDFEKAFANFETNELIIKPSIGANADFTYRIKKNETIDYKKLSVEFENRECFIQPFMQSIINEGEFSLFYFNDALCHTILKTVSKGDFRVQQEHGGVIFPVKKPESDLVKAADKAMDALPQKPFYARVDLVRTLKNTFALMELELIEPCLYFKYDKDSPTVFANCIDKFWKDNLS